MADQRPQSAGRGWAVFAWWAVIMIVVVSIALVAGWGGRFRHPDSTLQRENSNPSVPR
jgi:hypothetical protein